MPDEATVRTDPPGRDLIAAIGIDRYATWPELRNAVSDASGAIEHFWPMGFDLAMPPLLDEAASRHALHQLVVDQLRALDTNDRLVVFFAGHGCTRESPSGGAVVKTGYIIPADADRPTGGATSWIQVDHWLSHIAQLPPKHILVILDACHSGIALDRVSRWRHRGLPSNGPLAELQTRRSRRVITSALDNQVASDSGPMPGHSLFTGCLIEALTGGLARDGRAEITGTQLASYIQERVVGYPGSSQTPDLGAFDGDDRGELVVSLSGGRRARDAAPARPAAAGREPAPELHPPTPLPALAVASERPVADEAVRSELAVQLLLMWSIDEHTWSVVPRNGEVPAESKLRALIRPQQPCRLVLAIEAFAAPLLGVREFLREEVDLRVVTPPAGSLRPDEWHQIPARSLLAEREPQRTRGWMLHFVVIGPNEQIPAQIGSELTAPHSEKLSRAQATSLLASWLPPRAELHWQAVDVGLRVSWGLGEGGELAFVHARPPFVVTQELRFS